MAPTTGLRCPAQVTKISRTEPGAFEPSHSLLSGFSPSSCQRTTATAALQETSGAEGLTFGRNKKRWRCRVRQEEGKGNERGKEKAGNRRLCCDGKGVKGSAPCRHVPHGTWAKAEGPWGPMSLGAEAGYCREEVP